MTDETKSLFDAPWYVFSSPDDEITVIENESGRVLAELDDVKTANRLAHLPDLYDALFDSVLRICSTCIGSNLSNTPLDDIGRYCRANCPVHKYTALLKKVRAEK